jgi:hypothetical protein
MYAQKILSLIPLLAGLVLFSCNKDDSGKDRGTVQIEITDSPADDANVKAVFVTVADVKVDGKSLEGFSKTTVEISALQNGLTEALCNTELDAGAYSEITLVLDYDQDASGAAPGCYVVDAGGLKKKLSSQASEIKLAYNFAIEAEKSLNLVADFDLRKCIARAGAAGEYTFATKAEMEKGIRVVRKDRCGKIEGDFSDLLSNSDKVVVYAYKKGSFNKGVETKAQGASGVQFSNAVCSAAVGANGKFELHFLEAGEYEIHFASYKQNAQGEMALNAMLSVDVLNSINLGAISVSASASVFIDVLVTGLLPL